MMEAFQCHTGIAAPLDRANIDTDAIIPKQFLRRIERSGFGQFLFFDWRFLDDGSNNPDFILNKKSYKKATVLVTRDNFGCGSSREHAPWALLDYGFKAIIAPSFADIFYNNCFKNGVLPVVLPNNDIEDLLQQIIDKPGSSLTVDLINRVITTEDRTAISFSVDEYRRYLLLNGLDDIALTLLKENKITEFEQKRVQAQY